MADESIQDRVSKLGVEYRNGLIEQMSEVLQQRPTDGEKIGPARELELWRMPTSPAAVIALKRGATLDEANQANAMWAQHMAEQGAPEELILETCRKFAYERGKYHARGSLKRECEWHEKMAAKALAQLAGQAVPDDDDETVGASTGGEASGGGTY